MNALFASCMHCGGRVEYLPTVDSEMRWYHTGYGPHDHAPCPFKVNPENWLGRR